jgi:pteridine reductase
MESGGRVAIVTGGARRVGRAVVQRFIAGGFRVLFTYLHSDADARQLEQESGARGIWADLTDPQDAAGIVGDAIDRDYGRADVLVNNASIYEPGDLRSTTPAQLRRLWAIHAEAPMLLCRRLEGLLRHSQGHVINMVDLLAEKPWPAYLGYCASKAALSNLTLGLARELAPEVKVNGIAPGVVEWPDDAGQEERDRYLRRVPLGRAGRPADVAELAHFLCTAGSYITGQIIRLDGGRSIMG